MRDSHRVITICAVLTVVTCVPYSTVLSCRIVSFDDPWYVVNNPYVTAGLSWAGLRYAFTTFHCQNWHPLTWLSLQLDASLFGLNPAGYHATNVLLHIMNVVLVFLIWRQMTSQTWASSCVAALFALHPLHVESVAWVSERKDVLSTFFMLMTIAAYVRYARRASRLGYAIVLALYVAGLLAKPMLVTLPILLLLIDWWPLRRVDPYHGVPAAAAFPRRPIRYLIWEKAPLFVIAISDGIMTILAQQKATGALVTLPMSIRVANLSCAYSWYLQKTFYPVGLTALYPHPGQAVSWFHVTVGIVVFVTISSATLWYSRTRPHLLVGWTWFVVSLLPVVGLMQVGMQAYADRYVYIPHLGLFTAIVWEVNRLLAGIPERKTVATAGMMAVSLICASLTFMQVSCWRDSTTLWTQAIEIVPDNSVAHHHLAGALRIAGNHKQAIEQIDVALSGDGLPNRANAYWARGVSWFELDDLRESEQCYLNALKIDPNHEPSLNQMVKLLNQQNRVQEASLYSDRHARVLTQESEQKLDEAAKPQKLGLILARQGRFLEAIEQFEKTIQLDPQSASAHNNLALALSQTHRNAEAKTHFQKAIQLNPQLAAAHVNLGEILHAEKDIAGARRHFIEALRLNPEDLDTKRRLEESATR